MAGILRIQLTTGSVNRTKGKQQHYFNGVFLEASDNNKIIKSEDSGEESIKKKEKNIFFCCNIPISQSVTDRGSHSLVTRSPRLEWYK